MRGHIALRFWLALFAMSPLAASPASAADFPIGADVLVGGAPEGVSSSELLPGRGRTVGPSLTALSLSGPIDPSRYRMGPGDLVRLQWWGRLTRSAVLEVGPEGVLAVPELGTLQVSGSTLAEVREQVIARLRPRFQGVSVDLRLERPRTFSVQLTGELRAPGPVAVVGSQTVGDVLQGAQLGDNASTRRIEVRHRDGTLEVADLELLRKGGRARMDPALQDGDIVHVPVGLQYVWMQGAVARPGRYELGPADSLQTLIELCGGMLPSAEPSRMLLVRFREGGAVDSSWIALSDVASRRVVLPLQDGDRLYVRYVPGFHVQREALVLGEVAHPGLYPIEEGSSRLSALIESAGGFLPSADLWSIRVHRRVSAAGEKDAELDRLLRLSRADLTSTEYAVLNTRLASQREDYRVDWRRIRANPDLDLLLRDGDAVRVERLVSSVRVDGEVERPGILNFVSGLSAGDYVRQAGGFTRRAWKSRVLVTRAVTGQTVGASSAAVLNPGDLIWVPERPEVSLWSRANDLLTAVGAVATIVIAIRTVR